MKNMIAAAVALFALAALYCSHVYHYLLFHSLTEVFAVIIACGIFMVAWNSRRFFDNHFLLFVGIAYVFVGALDLAHMFAYKGMPILPGNNANAATQLWIGARYLESLTLLAAPLWLNRRLRPGWLVLGYSALTTLLLLSIFYWRIFPDCFLEDAGGLTAFKKTSEYVISSILLVSGALIVRFRKRFEPGVLRWMLASIGLTILSELLFTSYVSVYGPANMLGHIIKIASFFCVYKAIIETGLARPYELLFRDLKQSRERYRSLFMNMIDGYASHRIICDENGRPVDYQFIEVNDAFRRMTGVGDVAGRRVTQVMPGIEKDSTDWIGIYGKVALTGRSIRFENYSEKLARWYEVAAYCPEIGHFVTIFEDITQRKQTETDLRRQREWLRVILSSIGDAVIATDHTGRISFMNPVAADLTGWTAEQAESQSIHQVFNIVNEQSRESAEDIVAKVLSEDKIFRLSNHTVLISRDGRETPVEDSAAPIRDAGGSLIGAVVVFHDVTDRRRDQAALRRSAARFKLLSDTAGRLLATDNPQGLVADLGRSLMAHLDCQIFVNYLIDESTQRLCLNACAGISAADIDRVEWQHSGTIGCSTVCGPDRAIGNDILNACALRSTLMNAHGVRVCACHPLKVQQQLIGTLSFGTCQRAQFTAEEIDLMRIVADQIAQSIERVQNQQYLRRINEVLESKVKERTATLADIVDTLQQENGLRQQAENKLKRANKELSTRARQLRELAGELTMAEQRERKRLSQLLHDGLQQYLAVAKLQLGGLAERIADPDVKKTANDIEAFIGESIQISRSLSAELSPPVLYAGGLPAGLQWLVRWMRDKHEINIDLEMESIADLDEDVKVLVFESVRELLFNTAKHAHVSWAQVSLQQMESAGIRITVSDRGAGFDVQKVKPGRDHGGGYGLLSIRERIDLIGGTFEIDSSPGHGSRFVLSVPHVRKIAARPDSAPDPRTAGDTEPEAKKIPGLRVLIADDHSLFRDGVARLVKREADLEVVGQARNGLEAIELAHKLTPDVILMDISMPGLNGIEATRRIHRDLPHIRIIGLSMHEDQHHAAAMHEAGAVGYKNKGCQACELVDAIRSCSAADARHELNNDCFS